MSIPVDETETSLVDSRDDNSNISKRQDAAATTTIGESATAASKEQVILRLQQQLQAKDAEMQAKEAENATLKEDLSNLATMEKTYQQTTVNSRKRKYTIPEIKLNDQVDPHNTKNGHGKKGNMEEAEEEITAEFVSVDAWNDVENVTIPTKLRTNTEERAKPITSVLGSKADNGKGGMHSLEYLNEACVQDLVKALVEDMVKCLGLSAILRVHVEMSIFSGVPDVVVVSYKDNPLLFIEVKSPERRDKEGEVFAANDVGVQVWNYLMGFKKMGHEIPIACLSTYNKLAIITADDLAKKPEHKNFLSFMRNELSTDTSTCVCPKDTEEVSCEDNAKASPTKPKVKLTDLPKNVAGEEDRDEKKPKIFMSQVFVDGQVPQALLAALLASHYHSKDNKKNEKLQVVEHDDELSGLFSPKVSTSGMVWTTIRKDVKANYKMFPRDDTEYFYLLARIGHGSCGKVYLASTMHGCMCAIKLYIPKRSSCFSHAERQEEYQENLKAKAASRDTEMQQWGVLYPEVKVQRKEINGLPALLMVYGSQLDRSERKTRMEEVKAELERFAEKGLAYKNSDLRWRHVVLVSGRILLVDLESLEDISALDDDERVKLVMTQCSRLELRIGDDKSDELEDNLF